MFGGYLNPCLRNGYDGVQKLVPSFSHFSAMPRGIPLISPPCPECGSTEARITCTKRRSGIICRYRKCTACRHTFVTQQHADSLEAAVPKNFGACNRHKLTPEDAKELRKMAAEGASSMECGLAFEINQRTAYNVIVRNTYRHVA